MRCGSPARSTTRRSRLNRLPTPCPACARRHPRTAGAARKQRQCRCARPSGWRAGACSTWRPRPRAIPALPTEAPGIALAFARLAEAGGDIQFRAAAREAIAFERASFDTRAGGWPDFRFTGTEPDGSTPCSTMWCHGAPGIGLARLALLPIADDTAFADEIETAIAATLDFGRCAAPTICVAAISAGSTSWWRPACGLAAPISTGARPRRQRRASLTAPKPANSACRPTTHPKR